MMGERRAASAVDASPTVDGVDIENDGERIALAVEALKAARSKSRRRIAELERRRAALVRLRLALEPVKERHYALQQSCPSDEVDGWRTLADTAEDVLALETGVIAESEAMALIRDIALRLERLECRLAGRGRSEAGRRLAADMKHRERKREVARTLLADRLRPDDRRTYANPSTAKRWPSDDETGPASLVVRQPALSNAPPLGHGPAHHHAASV